MASLVNHKGLQVLDSATGDGGNAINNDLKYLVDWNPKSNWTATVDPTKDDDSSPASPANNYQVGSLWFNSYTGSLFLCVDATVGAAVWRGIPSGVIGMTTDKVQTDVVGPTELFLVEGDDYFPVVPADTTWSFEVTALARSTGNDSAVFQVKGAIKRVGTTASLVGTPTKTTYADTGASTWDFNVSASGDRLEMHVTGTNTQTIDWVGQLRIVPLTV